MILVADTSAPVAQWIRASVFGTEGRRFESYPVYHFFCEKTQKAGHRISLTLNANPIRCTIFYCIKTQKAGYRISLTLNANPIRCTIFRENYML